MSEVQPRPSGPRGRGSTRGGRGGVGSRGGRGGPRQTNGSKIDSFAETSVNEDEGEIGELKKKYASNLTVIKEMFPAWTDEDIVFALQETSGDLEATIDRISEGNISQWGEVKKKSKERSQSKPKDAAVTATDTSTQPSRGGRGRGGLEGGRGGRGRGTDRGRGVARGGRGGLINGSRDTASTKKEEASADSSWDSAPTTDGTTGSWDTAAVDSTPLESSWENITAGEAPVPAAKEQKPSSKPDGTRSWASMFSKPAPVPAAPKAQVAQPTPTHDAPIEPPIAAASIPTEQEMPGLPPPPAIAENLEAPITPPVSDVATSDPANITPSKDDLTETNLQHVPDTSEPPPAATAASTVASTIDRQSVLPSQHQQALRPSLGGYATSAYKATGMPGMPGRSASYQRKILEQQEAVVMPEKHAVDRAAVQFGSMGLNGSTDDDVDSDREDAETRAQPPQHSPIAPRAALPPAPQGQSFPQQPQADALPAPRQAPGLPPVNQVSSIQQLNQALPGDPGSNSQANYPYNRYGQQSAQEISAPAQKPYEPFGQQVQQAHQYDGFPPSSQGPSQTQQQAQSIQGGYSSAPGDMSSYYTSDNQRNAYQNNYYGTYGQQPAATNQDTSTSQQRGTSAFGASAAEQSSHFPTNQAQSQPGQNRYGHIAETQNSGHSTPNPSNNSQQHSNQPHQMLQQQGHGQAGGQYGGYPYSHPYYGSPYYSGHMNQVSSHSYGRDRPMFDDARRYEDQYLTQNHQFYGSTHGGYGGGPFGGAGGKHGMYGQPQQGYGMSPQTTYDPHSASPANVGAFGQHHSSATGRESAVPGGLSNYGRTGSTQPSETPQQFSGAGTSSHGNVSDAFGRSQSGYPGQNSGLGGHMNQQGGNEDSLRAYGDSSKVPGGPSPALGQPGARPGSAATPQAQSGLPAPQGQSQGQQGYGGYMGQMHGQGGSQYGSGPGGLGGHHQYGGQNNQGGGYGAYGAGYGSSSYGSSNRGGWGVNYGH
ncbi:RNAPII degradation factor [Lecanora helva]